MAWVILAIILSLSVQPTFAGEKCAEVLQESKSNFELQSQIDRAISDLANLRLTLDLAKARGLNSIELTALAADYKNKEKAIVEFLESQNIMSRDSLIEKLKNEIAKLQKIEVPRAQEEEARNRAEQVRRLEEAVVDGTRAIFHPIEPGSFRMGKVGNQVDVTLTQPFEMMATPTTQIIWRKIAELANSKLGYKLNTDPSHFKGDTRPVERVSYNDVQEWILALNQLSQMGEESLLEIIPSHNLGDVYRLPTEAEWEFVARGRGQYNDLYFFGGDPAQLVHFAWFAANSGNQTHPVAKKRPLVIDDKEFYDILGNVGEWVMDVYDDKLLGGVDPLNKMNASPSPTFVIRSAGSTFDEKITRVALRSSAWPEIRSMDVGFRIVRTK